MRQIPFRIIDLHVDSFSISENTPDMSNPVGIETSYEFGVNTEEKLVVARIKYKYVQNSVELLQMTLSSTFHIKPEAFASMINDNKFTLEPFFSQYLSTINVGAARGEIHARCEFAQSELSNIILPPINLVEALPHPIEIEIPSQDAIS